MSRKQKQSHKSYRDQNDRNERDYGNNWKGDHDNGHGWHSHKSPMKDHGKGGNGQYGNNWKVDHDHGKAGNGQYGNNWKDDHDHGNGGKHGDKNDRDDVIKINASEAQVQKNLGLGDDTVKVSANTANQFRLTFTSAEVGNGNPFLGMATSGALAVSLQAEYSTDMLVGAISRFDDEGITFEAKGGVTFDVRDTSGTQRGDQFAVARLGTVNGDRIDESGSNKSYYINAGMGNDTVIGSKAADFLVGGAGADTLNGTFGNDSYIGGGGADTFVFDTALGSNNADRILDFTAADDTIRLDNDVFTGLSPGGLAAGAFALSTDTPQADDRIIYNTSTGQVFFDADGNGGAQVQFATLLNTAQGATMPTAATGVTAADFVVYSDNDRNNDNGRNPQKDWDAKEKDKDWGGYKHDARHDRDDHKGKDRDHHKDRHDRDDHKGKDRDDHKGKDRDHQNNDDLARGDQKLLEKIFGKDAVKDADQFFGSSFLALNDSGVSGAALLMFDEESGALSVAVSAHGLTPNQQHIQHIHGFTGANPMNSSVPDNDQDDDRDGFVEIAEGSDTYGPVLLNFTPFPTADANGDIFFVNEYQLPSAAGGGALGLDIPPDLTLREIVLHGLTIPAGFGIGSDGRPTPGEVNGTGGYIPQLPVASNEIEALNSADGKLALTEFRNELNQNDWQLA